MIGHCPEPAARRPVTDASPRDLLDALVNGWCLSAVVPRALDLAERDPLMSAGCFPGDLVRGLMCVRGDFWSRYSRLYQRYTAVLRASAAARRRLPPEERMAFWTPLEPAVPTPPAPPTDPADPDASSARPSSRSGARRNGDLA